MNSISEIQQDQNLVFQTDKVNPHEDSQLVQADAQSSESSAALSAILGVGAVFTLIGSAIMFSASLPTAALLLAVTGVALTVFAITSGMSGAYAYTNSRPVVFDTRPAVINRWNQPAYIYRDPSYQRRPQPIHVNLNTAPRRSGRVYNPDRPAVVNLQTRARHANRRRPVRSDRPVVTNLAAQSIGRNRTNTRPAAPRPASSARPARTNLQRGVRQQNRTRVNQSNQRQAPARTNLSRPTRRVNPTRSATGRGSRSVRPNVTNLNRSDRRRAG